MPDFIEISPKPVYFYEEPLLEEELFLVVLRINFARYRSRRLGTAIDHFGDMSRHSRLRRARTAASSCTPSRCSAWRERWRLFVLQKTTSSRIFLVTNGFNYEEAL